MRVGLWKVLEHWNQVRERRGKGRGAFEERYNATGTIKPFLIGFLSYTPPTLGRAASSKLLFLLQPNKRGCFPNSSCK
jgi:hypothetical protein